MGRTVQAGIAATAVVLLGLGVAAQKVPIRYVPADLQTTQWLQQQAAAQVKASAGLAAFHDFQFTDRLAESGINFKSPHRGRRRQGLQGGALRSRDRDRDCRRRRRRPPRHLLRQPGGRQPVVAESRRRPLREHHRLGRRGGRGQGQRLGLVRRHRQRRRRGPLRDHGPRRQHALRERRQGALQGHLRGVGPQLHGTLVGRGVLRLRPRRQARSVPGQRRTVHDQHHWRRGGREVLRGVRGRLLRTPASGALRSQHPLSQRRARTTSWTCRRRPGSTISRGRATRAWWTSTTTAGPISTC